MNRIFHMLSIIFIVSLIFFVYSGNLHANTILSQHSGSNNPTTEGWTHNYGSGGGTTSGAINDGGTAAWYVDDTSVSIHTWESYTQTVNSAQIADASLYGWVLTANLRMISGTTGVHNSMHVLYRNGTTDWAMSFNTDSDGDPIIQFGDPYYGTLFGSYTIEGGEGANHTYSLVYDSVDESADLFVNGIERISDYTGNGSTTATVVGWGAGASNGTC